MKRVNFQTRCEYIGLSSEVASLPTEPKEGEYLCSGSTFLAVDTMQYYIFYEETKTWYPTGGSA